MDRTRKQIAVTGTGIRLPGPTWQRQRGAPDRTVTLPAEPGRVAPQDRSRARIRHFAAAIAGTGAPGTAFGDGPATPRLLAAAPQAAGAGALVAAATDALKDGAAPCPA